MNEIQIGHRKIQKISKAHYVNLPKLWIINNKAKNGDCVDVRLEPDGSLNIRLASCQQPAMEKEGE